MKIIIETTLEALQEVLSNTPDPVTAAQILSNISPDYSSLPKSIGDKTLISINKWTKKVNYSHSKTKWYEKEDFTGRSSYYKEEGYFPKVSDTERTNDSMSIDEWISLS